MARKQAPIVTAIDAESDVWLAVATHVRGRITALSTELESFSLSPESTAIVRGRLSELRKMLALPETTAPDKSATTPPGDVAQLDPVSGHEDE